jgi:hypothetical protein
LKDTLPGGVYACMGLNDGGIKRGDREDTGDLEAQPTESVGREGSGARGGDGGPSGNVTGNPGGFSGGRTIGSTYESGTPTYEAVEHGDAEGYIENDGDDEKEK